MNAHSQLSAVCPKCVTANAVGSRFCGKCGQTLAADGPSIPPTPPPQPPPNYNINIGGAGAGGQGETGLDMTSAQTALHQAILAAGGKLGPQVSSSQGSFTIEHGKWWMTLWMKVRLDGQYTLTPSAQGGTHVSVSLNTSMNALIPILAINLVCGLLLGPLVFVALVTDAYTWWYYNQKAPRELEQTLLNSVRSGSGVAYASAPTAPAPPAPVQSVPALAASPSHPQNQVADAKPAAAEDPYEQLRKLAALRDAGAITPAEFDAKKTTILDRL